VAVTASDLAGRTVPQRDYHVGGLLPVGTVTSLDGDGGTGKSTLALQLGVATALGGHWCGRQVQRTPVLCIGAEDDADELHRRLAAITSAQGIDLAHLSELRVLSMAGEDARLMVEGEGNGLVNTALARDLEASLKDLRPGLLILDTLADLFGGNENDRGHARQFVGMLSRWALKFSMAVLLLTHPSLAGMSSGRGTSGTTGWRNSVRTHLELRHVEGDSDARRLRLTKSNYGRSGTEIMLRWVDGYFAVDGAALVHGLPIGHAGEALQLLQKIAAKEGSDLAVPMSAWMSAWVSAKGTIGRKPDSLRRGLVRIRERLVSARFIEVNGDSVTLVGQAGHQSDNAVLSVDTRPDIEGPPL